MISPNAQNNDDSAGQQTLGTTPAVTASATLLFSCELSVDLVIPDIYLTKNFISWNEDNLRSHGFTHIIIIDKHIQELYYPSPVFKLATTPTSNVDPYDSFDDYYTPVSKKSLNFGKEFEAIDLNFGEKSYLITVLPNCYRAVKFIHKALQSGGTILVIDCNGGEQKCLTIIVAYLMYKHKINFNDAFKRLKEHYKNADLDRFYMRQLYEYEPILQVQREHSQGHCCSRDARAATLKRKFTTDELKSNKFLDSLNPLSQFISLPKQQNIIETETYSLQTNSHIPNNNYLGDMDDYAME